MVLVQAFIFLFPAEYKLSNEPGMITPFILDSILYNSASDKSQKRGTTLPPPLSTHFTFGLGNAYLYFSFTLAGRL